VSDSAYPVTTTCGRVVFVDCAIAIVQRGVEGGYSKRRKRIAILLVIPGSTILRQKGAVCSGLPSHPFWAGILPVPQIGNIELIRAALEVSRILQYGRLERNLLIVMAKRAALTGGILVRE
jgi:hypothetical protein